MKIQKQDIITVSCVRVKTLAYSFLLLINKVPAVIKSATCV